jgi:hypothetical protein
MCTLYFRCSSCMHEQCVEERNVRTCARRERWHRKTTNNMLWCWEKGVWAWGLVGGRVGVCLRHTDACQASTAAEKNPSKECTRVVRRGHGAAQTHTHTHTPHHTHTHTRARTHTRTHTHARTHTHTHTHSHSHTHTHMANRVATFNGRPHTVNHRFCTEHDEGRRREKRAQGTTHGKTMGPQMLKKNL